MTGRKLAQEVAVRLGRESGVATWGWCELVTHPAASEVRDQYVSAAALGIAMRLGGEGRDAFPSLRTLSQRLSISRKVLRRSVWALEAGGWLDAVGHGPRGTIRWNATVPVDVYRVMENAHHGDGLPWVELLADERVAAAVVEAFRPVVAYVEASKRDREPVGDTVGATERPVGDTVGATEPVEVAPAGPEGPVGDTADATGKEAPESVGDTASPGVGDTVGTRTSRDPTYGYYEKGSTDAGANENACRWCGSTSHRWGCEAERSTKASA